MSTLRLRTLQQPSQLERLLEAFVTHEHRVPEEAYQIRDPEGLPVVLQSVLRQASEIGRVWACWATSEQTWLFTCQPLASARQEQSSVQLHINHYDSSGRLRDSGCWMRTAQDGWQRCAG